MSWNKQNIQTLIGLIVMGLSLATCVLSNRSQTMVVGISRALQVFATIILIFGIRKAHPAHKAKMLLFWLGITSFFCTTLIALGLQYIPDYGFRYYRCEMWFATFLPLLAAAGVLYMMNIIYKEYVELTHPEQLQEVKQPPVYDSNFQKLLVSINEKN